MEDDDPFFTDEPDYEQMRVDAYLAQQDAEEAEIPADVVGMVGAKREKRMSEPQIWYQVVPWEVKSVVVYAEDETTVSTLGPLRGTMIRQSKRGDFSNFFRTQVEAVDFLSRRNNPWRNKGE